MWSSDLVKVKNLLSALERQSAGGATEETCATARQLALATVDLSINMETDRWMMTLGRPARSSGPSASSSSSSGSPCISYGGSCD